MRYGNSRQKRAGFPEPCRHVSNLSGTGGGQGEEKARWHQDYFRGDTEADGGHSETVSLKDSLLTEILSFRRGDNLATVVTDGITHRTYELELTRKHGSLNRAIAYLEAKGYSIEIDKFNAI